LDVFDDQDFFIRANVLSRRRGRAGAVDKKLFDDRELFRHSRHQFADAGQFDSSNNFYQLPRHGRGGGLRHLRV